MPELNFDGDMARMQSLFEQVKHEYDLYFSGARKEPPSRERAELASLVKVYTNSTLARLSQQFMFTSFANKYNLHNELWNKWMRAREDGLDVDPRLPAALRKVRREMQALEVAPPGGTMPKAAETGPQKAPAPAKPVSNGGRLRALYDDFLNAKLKMGQMPEWDFHAFEAHLIQQREAILAKYQGKDVAFSVKTQDGKVSLKAKVLK